MHPCNITYFIGKQQSQQELRWQIDIQNTPKLRTYKLLKENFCLENYISMNIPKHVRSTMAQFRCGVLPLRIETGRFRGEPVSERTCKFCILDEIEDEFHFLLKCALYNNLRIELYQNVNFSNNSYLSQDNLLQTLICNFPRQTANFIHSAFKLRQSKFSPMH